MHALHSTLLPASSIQHSLFLPNFTPSTIYPLPTPHIVAPTDIRVVGNLVVAGGSDLRVFEIREECVPVQAAGDGALTLVKGEGELGGVEEDFYDIGPSDVNIIRMQLCALR